LINKYNDGLHARLCRAITKDIDLYHLA